MAGGIVTFATAVLSGLDGGGAAFLGVSPRAAARLENGGFAGRLPDLDYACCNRAMEGAHLLSVLGPASGGIGEHLTLSGHDVGTWMGTPAKTLAAGGMSALKQASSGRSPRAVRLHSCATAATDMTGAPSRRS